MKTYELWVCRSRSARLQGLWGQGLYLSLSSLSPRSTHSTRRTESTEWFSCGWMIRTLSSSLPAYLPILLHEPYILLKCTSYNLTLLLTREVLLTSFFGRKGAINLFKYDNADMSARIKFLLQPELQHWRGVERHGVIWFSKCPTFNSSIIPTYIDWVKVQ